MDREGFRDRMKQYKKAREESPGLKYWEWKDIPKYDEGGEVEPDPLEILERSKPKFHGIPLAKGNIDGVFSPIDVPLATLPKVWPVVNKWLPNYGQMLGALVGGDDGLTVNRKIKPLTTKQIDADVKEHYEDIVVPLRPQEDYIKQIYLQNPDNFAYNVYADNALPDNRLADFNNATGEVRIKESILNSPISSQIQAHEINGHRSDRSLPRSKEARAIIDKAFNVRKKPLSKESKLLAEKEAETTRLSYNFYKHMKDNGLLQIKKPMTKTKAYQDYVLNATDDQIDEMLGNSTVYSRDYKASGIDYDNIRWALAYAPEIAAGLIIPQHLLSNDEESKQWI